MIRLIAHLELARERNADLPRGSPPPELKETLPERG